MKAAERAHTSLIYADAGGASRLVADGLTAGGNAFIVATTPLDAVVILQQLQGSIDAFFVSSRDNPVETQSLCTFLSTYYPHVRRIGFRTDELEPTQWRAGSDAHYLLVLRHQQGRKQLAASIKQSLGCA